MTAAPAGGRPLAVVGVDGSEPGERALRWAEDWARATHATLQLLTVCQHPVAYEYATPDIFEACDRHAAEISEKAAASCTLPTDRTEPRVIVGAPAPVLVDASRDADLLVVGRHGPGGVAGALAGSVSTACAHRAHCPVVVVR